MLDTQPRVRGGVVTRAGVRRVRAYCALCGVHCPIVCAVEDGRLTKVEADKEHPLGGAFCVKGRAAPELLYHPDRLLYPLRRTRPKGDEDPGWERITWEEALETIARRLLEIRDQSGPEAVAFCKATPSGSSIADADPWIRRLANAFASPNLISTTHVCNWHKDTGSTYTYGYEIPTPDFARTGCVLLWGHNPSATSIGFAQEIVAARSRGAKLMVVDPRRAGLAGRADVWLQVRPGADGALALSLIHVFIEQGLFDREFVLRWTNGPFLVRRDTGRLLTAAEVFPGGEDAHSVAWDAAAARPVRYDPSSGRYSDERAELALEGSYLVPASGGGTIEAATVFQLLRELAADYAPEQAQAITWVPAQRVAAAARLLAQHRPVCYYAYNGVGQHTNATQTNRAIATLYVLTGSLDAPGGNVIYAGAPVRGVLGRELLPPERAERRLGYRERPLGPPAKPGNVTAYDVYRAILEGKPYPLRAILSFGSNTLLDTGDSLTGREAFRRLEFFAIAELFLTPTAQYADIVLPASTFLERGALKSDFARSGALMGYLQYRQPVVEPRGEARADSDIVFDLALRLGLGPHFWDGDVNAAYAYHLSPSGVSLEALKDHPEGVAVPSPLRYRKYAELDPKTGSPVGFPTPTRKVELYCTEFAHRGYDPLPVYREPALSPVSRPDLAAEYPLILTNAKQTHYCHSQHRALPTLRKAAPHPLLEIHPQTAAAWGVADGDWVAVETPAGSARAKAKLSAGILPGVVCGQHGWWQGAPELGLEGYDPFSPEGANLSLLIANDATDPISGSVPYRSYLCRLRKAD